MQIKLNKPGLVVQNRIALKTWRIVVSTLIFTFLLLQAACSSDKEQVPFDLVFTNGLVIDGSGDPPFIADIAISDGVIKAIGNLSGKKSAERVDITGMAIAPGFIDVHSHAEEALIRPDLKTNKGFVTQGVTTSVFGVDGGYATHDMDAIRETLERQGVGTNFMFFVGHNGIREAVMGLDDRSPSDADMDQMKNMVREAMAGGAVGLSSGLMYLPGNYASTSEMIELATVVGEFNGIYESHVRDPADNLLDSISECLTIAREAGVAAHPAHIKAVGGKNFGAAKSIVQLITEQQRLGLEVTTDLYPYDGAAARNLSDLLLPPLDWPESQKLLQIYDRATSDETREMLQRELDEFWPVALDDPERRRQIKAMTENPPEGVFSWIKAVGYSSFRIVVARTPGLEGRMVLDIAKANGVEPFDLLADLIVKEGKTPKLTLGAIQESDVRELITQPWVMISSDGRESGIDGPSGHPRFRGSFPRVLGRYVREWQVLSLEEAVRKMTSLPASYLRLKNRGLLKQGYNADITVFKPEEIIDRSTWAEPWLYSQGVVHVLVNGEFAMRDEQMTGGTYGRYIRFEGIMQNTEVN